MTEYTKNVEDDDEDSTKHTKPFHIKREVAGHNYIITLSEEIVDPPFEYQELCNLLRETVNEEDAVTFHVSNYGGCCDSAATLVNAIKDCKGETKAVVNAPSYSAATMITLACDEVEIKPYAFLMFHNFSSRTGGKGGELKANVHNTERVIHSMMRDLYDPFLSQKEINDIFNDKDVYVHWDDKNLINRLNKHHNITKIEIDE